MTTTIMPVPVPPLILPSPTLKRGTVKAGSSTPFFYSSSFDLTTYTPINFFISAVGSLSSIEIVGGASHVYG